MSRPFTREEMYERERIREERHRVTDAAIADTGTRQAPWTSVAMEAVLAVAKTQPSLTTDDVWGVLDVMCIPRPDEPRAMGSVMRRAVRDRVVDITNVTRQSQRAVTADGGRHHVAPVRLYVSRLVQHG